MGFTVPTTTARWNEAIALSRVVDNAVGALSDAKRFLAEFKDVASAEVLSADAVQQVMLRAAEYRDAIARLQDADVQAWLAVNAEALPDKWADALVALIAACDDVAMAAKAALPVSADGTLALATVSAKGQVSVKQMQPTDMRAIGEKIGALIAKA